MYIIVIAAVIWVIFKYKATIKRLLPNKEDSVWDLKYRGGLDSNQDTKFNIYVHLTTELHHRIVKDQPRVVLDVISSYLSEVEEGVTLDTLIRERDQRKVISAILDAKEIDPTAKAIISSFFEEVMGLMVPSITYNKTDFFTAIRYAIG